MKIYYVVRWFLDQYVMQNMKKVVKQSEKLNEADFDFTAIPADSLEGTVENWDIVWWDYKLRIRLIYQIHSNPSRYP